ncbi:MAG TPA: caspase family protein, partial [Chitinophagaceae bacterium]|nr:caspase family protein [Chitinophagaceae bacterium]
GLLDPVVEPTPVVTPQEDDGELGDLLRLHQRPSFDRRSNKWILKNGDKILPLQDYPDSLVNNGWLSPGKKTIVTTGENDSLVRTWDPHSGKLTNTFKNECKIRKRLVFDPRGNWVVFTNNRFASTDGSDEMWKNLEKELNSPVSDAKDTLNAKDAAGTNELITPVTDSSWDFKIVDLLSGNTIFKVQDESDFLSTPAFSDSSKYFMLYSASSVRVWDTRSWRTVLVLDLNNEYDDATVNINHAGTNALVTSNYSTTLFETRSNKRLFTLPDVVDNASFSADDQYILTTSPDMQLKIWDARNGKMLFTYYAFENNDYLVLDEFGRYDGTEKARKNLYYVCGDEIIDLEQFKDLGWEPKLAAKIMGTDKEPITAKKISEINICNVTPVVEEKGMSNGNYQYQITPRSGGLGEVQLYIKVDNNEKLIKRYDPNAFPKVGNASVLFIKPESIRDFLVSGTINGLNVKATTKDGTMTSRGTTVGVISETREVKNPDVYLVSIGISQYKADKLKLAYASKDATDFSSALALSAKKLLNTDGKEHVTSYTFSTSEGSQYWPSKQAIIKTLDSISKKATADDIFVIFFAGHGVMKSGQKNLYLLTAEATAFEMEGVEKEVAISFDELKIWMQKIKANKQLVILDACNSGQAVQNLKQLFTKRDVPADQQRALEDLKDKTGTYIISASASGQSAYETSLYGQGLLTYSLLSAIKLGDGLKDNKYIDVTKWFNTAAGNVKTMAQDIGGRQDPQIIGNASFNVGLVDKEVTDEIKLSIKKKVFRRSTLVREGPMPSDNLLGLSALVDKALNEVSSRGKESPLTYIPDNTLLDAYSIVGSYKAVGNDVTIKIFLLKGEQEDKPLFQTELIGTVDKKELLAQKIVVEIQRFLNQ